MRVVITVLWSLLSVVGFLGVKSAFGAPYGVLWYFFLVLTLELSSRYVRKMTQVTG